MIADLFSLAWFLLTIFCAIAIKCRDERIRGLERQNDYLRAMIDQTSQDRDDGWQLVAIKDKQLRGHLVDATILLDEVQRLGRTDDADAIVEDVARWLAGDAANAA